MTKLNLMKYMNLLKKDYPFQLIKLKDALFVSLSIMVILLLLRPFNLYKYDGNIWLLAFGYAAVTFSSMLLINPVKIGCHKLFPFWNIGLELLLTAFIIFFISIANYFYTYLTFSSMALSPSSFMHWIFITFSVGLFPSLFMVYHQYNRFRIKADRSSVLNEKEEISNIINFGKYSSKNDFQIEQNEFLYAEVQCNKVYVHFVRSHEVHTWELKTTFKNISDSICNHHIIQCHRSFIINIDMVEKIVGNSNGYKLKLRCVNEQIPVSRKYTSSMKALFDKHAILIH